MMVVPKVPTRYRALQDCPDDGTGGNRSRKEVNRKEKEQKRAVFLSHTGKDQFRYSARDCNVRYGGARRVGCCSARGIGSTKGINRKHFKNHIRRFL
jgi:hypothetical protein